MIFLFQKSSRLVVMILCVKNLISFPLQLFEILENKDSLLWACRYSLWYFCALIFFKNPFSVTRLDDIKRLENRWTITIDYPGRCVLNPPQHKSCHVAHWFCQNRLNEVTEPSLVSGVFFRSLFPLALPFCNVIGTRWKASHALNTGVKREKRLACEFLVTGSL